jgi:hypothetical protein
MKMIFSITYKILYNSILSSSICVYISLIIYLWNIFPKLDEVLAQRDSDVLIHPFNDMIINGILVGIITGVIWTISSETIQKHEQSNSNINKLKQNTVSRGDPAELYSEIISIYISIKNKVVNVLKKYTPNALIFYGKIISKICNEYNIPRLLYNVIIDSLLFSGIFIPILTVIISWKRLSMIKNGVKYIGDENVMRHFHEIAQNIVLICIISSVIWTISATICLRRWKNWSYEKK